MIELYDRIILFTYNEICTVALTKKGFKRIKAKSNFVMQCFLLNSVETESVADKAKSVFFL